MATLPSNFKHAAANVSFAGNPQDIFRPAEFAGGTRGPDAPPSTGPHFSSGTQHGLFYAKLRNIVSKTRDPHLIDELQSELNSLELFNIINPHASELAEGTVERLKKKDPNHYFWPDALRKRGIGPYMSLETMKKKMVQWDYDNGFRNNDRIYKRLEDKTPELTQWLDDVSALKRRQEWIFRTIEAVKELHDWYPFFVTLTVDPKKRTPKDVWQSGEFKKYIRKLAILTAGVLGVPNDGRNRISDRNFVRYISVIEHGKSGHHDHSHAIIWLRDIKDSWKQDPNPDYIYDTKRVNRRCLPLETYWELADQDCRPATYLRYRGDIWTRLGHNVPYVKGKPLELLGPCSVGAYLAKYLSKEKKQWNHRVRATRNIGMSRVNQLIKALTSKEIDALVVRCRTYSQSLTLSMTSSVPIGLLRSKAKREKYMREFKNLTLKELIIPKQNAFLEMQRSVEAGQRPTRLGSMDCWNWLQTVIRDQSGIVFCEEAFEDIVNKLKQVWPVRHNYSVRAYVA